MSDLSVAVANDLMEVLFERNPQPLEALAACILLIGHVACTLRRKRSGCDLRWSDAHDRGGNGACCRSTGRRMNERSRLRPAQ